MSHRTLLSVVALVVMLVPSVAHARIWTVFYNDAGRPGTYSKTSVIRTIQQALREYETAMFDGTIIARWGGETAATSGGAGTIVVTWRPLSADVCARTCAYDDDISCIWDGIHAREIQLDNSLRVDDPLTGNTRLNPLWVPPNANGNGFRCQDLRASLLHELAHNFKDITYDGPANSATILSYTINDLAGRHLWNLDAFHTYSGAGPHLTNIRVQLQDSATQAILSTSDFAPGAARPHTPVSITMGNGASVATGQGTFTRNFALAWGDRSGSSQSTVVRVSQHDGIAHFWDQVVPTNQGSLRRPCIAVSGQDQIVVFSGSAQLPDTNNTADSNAGLRGIFQSESHDGGFTWSYPTALLGQTRNGTSCDVDPVTGRVVLVVQGADDTLWTASRLPASDNGWTGFTRVEAVGNWKIPQTSDMPDIVFDRFSPTGSGQLAWLEDATLTHRVGRIRFNGTSYQFDTSTTPFIIERADPGAVASYELLRTTPVLSFDATLVFHLMTSTGGLMSAISQRNLANWPTTFTQVDFSFPPAPISWYTGAAQNFSSFTTGTVQRMLLNPS